MFHCIESDRSRGSLCKALSLAVSHATTGCNRSGLRCYFYYARIVRLSLPSQRRLKGVADGRYQQYSLFIGLGSNTMQAPERHHSEAEKKSPRHCTCLWHPSITKRTDTHEQDHHKKTAASHVHLSIRVSTPHALQNELSDCIPQRAADQSPSDDAS